MPSMNIATEGYIDSATRHHDAQIAENGDTSPSNDESSSNSHTNQFDASGDDSFDRCDKHDISIVQNSEESPKSDTSDYPQQDWVSMDVGKLDKSFYNADNSLTEQIKRLKIKTLEEYIHSGNADDIVEYLRSTDGLINNDIRRQVWPLFLGMSSEKLSEAKHAALFLDDLEIHDKPLHQDEDQVMLDIKRSFTILKHIQSSFASHTSFTNVYSSEEISLLKKSLYMLVIKLLRKYPLLHYYQGFHDVASIVLIVCYLPGSNRVDEGLSFKMLESLALNHLRDFMIQDINLSLVHLKLIPTLLEIVDHRFFKLIKQLNNNYMLTNGIYYDYSFYQGLLSILTMFSHDIDNLNQLLTVWDFSLSYGTVLINVYIYVAALTFKKDEVFKSLGIKDNDSTFHDVDKDLLHNLLSSSNLFQGLSNADLIQILNNAKSYFESYPITNLSNSSFTWDIWFREYSSNSVLLTTSKPYSKTSSLDLIDDPKKVQSLIETQDEEVSKLVLYGLAVEKKVFEENEVTDATEYESMGSLSGSLSSSLSSLHSSTSTLNSRILKTSSMYFKRLLFFEEEDGENTPVRRNNVFKLTTIYKISLTVGFLGFLLHFLLTKQHHIISKYIDTINWKMTNIGGWLNNVGLGIVRNALYGYLG